MWKAVIKLIRTWVKPSKRKHLDQVFIIPRIFTWKSQPQIFTTCCPMLNSTFRQLELVVKVFPSWWLQARHGWDISKGIQPRQKSGRVGIGLGWENLLDPDFVSRSRLLSSTIPDAFGPILRDSAWKNLGQSRLSPIFTEGLGFSISTQLWDQGAYPISISIFVEIGEGLHDSSRPCLLQAPEACVTLAWFGGVEHLDSSIVTLDAYHCDCTILVMS